MVSRRTTCVHSWSRLGPLMVLREPQSGHFPLQLHVAWWVKPEGQGCPSSMGVSPRGVLDWSDREEPAPHLPLHLPSGLASPSPWPSWESDESVRLSGFPSSDHLTSAIPLPAFFLFFWRGWALWGGEARPQHTVAQCLRPQASRPALYNAFVVCFFLPWAGGARVWVWVILV